LCVCQYYKLKEKKKKRKTIFKIKEKKKKKKRNNDLADLPSHDNFDQILQGIREENIEESDIADDMI